MSIFYNLNTKSHYSLLKSCLSIDDIIEFHKLQGNKFSLLTDNNLSGSMEFINKSIENNLTPILGLDLEYKNSHYLLISKSNKGYHNLLKIESIKNEVRSDEIINYLEDVIVIFISGDKLFDADYIDINTIAYNEALCKNNTDIKILKVLHCIKNDMKLDEISDFVVNDKNYLLTYDDAIKFFNEEQIQNTLKIIESCEWENDPYSIKLAKFKLPSNFSSSEQYLKFCCLEGLKAKIADNQNNVDKKYIDRLNYELQVINDMNFNDYFLIVSDFVGFAKKNGILIGPGRGSSAGSLVAYCLDITEVDPIKYNLMFERFLNPNRKSLPDIDIDVMDTRRQELIDYIFDKYHPMNTSYICTFQKIKLRMAIRDVGRVLNIDLKIIDKISKLIPLECNDVETILTFDEIKYYYETFPELFIYASKIINIPRQFSTHAAGVIIADDSLDNYIPVQKGIDDWLLSEFSMEYLEPLGLFKIDILGLKNLSIIHDVKKLIKLNKGIDVDLNKIDLDDKKLFDDICNGDTVGIFQLESPGMTSTIMKVKPKCIEDISICSALFRPGPQSLIPSFVKTRNKQIEPKYLNDEIKKVLEPTLGFCIYQEQVMELIKNVTNFSLSEADIFRRAISKKKESLFIEMKDKFIDAAVKNNFSEQEANNIYDFLIEFANYGFNHSHSLAYSFISYYMMHLKHYYPLEFFKVLLQYGDSQKNNLYISEAKRKGVNISNVDIRYSDINFSIHNNSDIMFGFMNIKGIGLEYAKKIIDIRNNSRFNEWTDIIASLYRNGINEKVLTLLVKVGAFDSFEIDRNFILTNMKEVIEKSSIFYNNKSVFDLEITNDYTPMSEQEKAINEYELLGFTFSNNQWNKIFEENKNEHKISKLVDISDPHQNYLIKIKKLRQTLTKYNKKMCFIEFEENGNDYSCASFSESVFSNLEVNCYYIVNLKNNDGKIQLLKVINKIEY